MLGLFGKIHFVELGMDKEFVGPYWTQVEIEFAARENLQPSLRYAGATVVKDVDGTLAQLVAACVAEQLVETVESVAAIIRGAIFDQLFTARHNARGAIWSATGTISSLGMLTYELLGRLRGRCTYGYRYVEELLSPDEQALLSAARPRTPTREENRRAARALWTWTRHVWREAERVLGQRLGIELDEEAMLTAIDRTYA